MRTMPPQIVQGEVKIARENLVLDLPLVKQFSTSVSEPQLKKPLYDSGADFWSVEFTTTPAQWRELEPELIKAKIPYTRYEMPDNYYAVQRAEEQKLKRIENKSKFQLIALLGGLMFLAGWVYMWADGIWEASAAIMIIGLLVMAFGNTAVVRFYGRIRDRRNR